MNLCVLIPAKDEEESLNETISNLYQELHNKIEFNILVINDHSNDSTENVLVNLSKKYENLEYLNNLFNSGVGNAIKFGLERWEGDIVVICMADSSDSPDDILVSYKKMIEGGYDCIFGSRFIKGSRVINYPIVKLFLNRLFNNLVMLLFRNNYNDYTNIFKMYSRVSIIKISPIQSNGFSIGLEMALKAFSRGLYIAHMPISWTQRKSGKSKLNLFKNIRIYLSTLIVCFNDSNKR